MRQESSLKDDQLNKLIGLVNASSKNATSMLNDKKKGRNINGPLISHNHGL
jgi:hypothetical protein